MAQGLELLAPGRVPFAQARGLRKSRLTEEQIASALRRYEAGSAAVELSREVGGSELSFYRWKRNRKYAGMGVAERRKVKQLERDGKLRAEWAWVSTGSFRSTVSGSSSKLGGSTTTVIVFTARSAIRPLTRSPDNGTTKEGLNATAAARFS